MGYIKEPKNVDLVVGPSILTEDIKDSIIGAIDQYHKTGKKPDSIGIVEQAPGHTGRPVAAKKTHNILRAKASRAL